MEKKKDLKCSECNNKLARYDYSSPRLPYVYVCHTCSISFDEKLNKLYIATNPPPEEAEEYYKTLAEKGMMQYIDGVWIRK